MSDLVRFGVSLDGALLEKFDKLIQQKGYPSRSEAFRDLIRNYLVEDAWTALKGEQVATLTLIYDHHTRELAERLTEEQHGADNLVVCSTHVHLTHRMCLEVVVLRGEAGDIRAMADRLIATRGVQHGKLTMTTLGHTGAG